jgi:hypothetical protein
LSIGTDHGKFGRWNHEFDGFFAFIKEQLEDRWKPGQLWNRRFSTPPTLDPGFANLNQEMDLTIESFNFCIGSLGSIRLSDPISLGSSTGKSAATTT